MSIVVALQCDNYSADVAYVSQEIHIMQSCCHTYTPGRSTWTISDLISLERPWSITCQIRVMVVQSATIMAPNIHLMPESEK